jgi:hypothetical protein
MGSCSRDTRAERSAAASRLGWGIAALVLVCASGCVTTGSMFACLDPDAPPAGTPTQVYFTPHPQVIFPPDIRHNGTPIPALAGRVYLFGPNLGRPMAGDGKVVVELYDPARPPVNGQAVPLTVWTLDQEMLKPGLHRDSSIGWGYTVVLPWEQYRPDITQVLIRVRYEPVKGTPLFTETQLVKFDPAQVQDFQVSNKTGQASEVLKPVAFAPTNNAAPTLNRGLAPTPTFQMPGTTR